jgi:excisionase family DNA binding protein
MSKDHVSMREAARLMGVSRQRMHQLLTKGRIPGAFLMECGRGRKVWVVPKGSIKPKDEA